MEKQYNVFEDDDLIFTGMEREANIVFDRLNTFLEHTHENVTMSEYNINITETPWYKCYDDFNNGYYSEPCFNDIEGLYDSTNKYVVKNNLQLKTIVNSSPVGANLSFIDTSNIAKCPNIKQKMILNWDTSTFTSYTYSFCVIYDDVQPYQYDLDWLYISNGADISDMFFNTKFCKKLPRMETKISFNEFVKQTGLIVTPELLTNNGMNVHEWCNDKNNQKLMETNELYEPMLMYWLGSDFITLEERFDTIQETNVHVFDI